MESKKNTSPHILNTASNLLGICFYCINISEAVKNAGGHTGG